MQYVSGRGLRIAFVTHKGNLNGSLTWFNSMKEIEFLKQVFKGSVVDGVSMKPDAKDFNTTFKQASKRRYDLIVMNLQKKYDSERKHAGFKMMNDFIKQSEAPVLALVDDVVIAESPSTNMSSFDNKMAVIGMKIDSKKLKDAGYHNVVISNRIKDMSVMLKSNRRFITSAKSVDFAYIGMLRNKRLRLVVDAFNALSRAGYSCKFYGADAIYDMDSEESSNILHSAEFEVLDKVDADKVVDVMSEAIYSILPRYDYGKDIFSNRIYEDDSANCLMLADEQYGLHDIFDKEVRYQNDKDLIALVKLFDDHPELQSYMLDQQHVSVEREYHASRAELEQALIDSVKELL
jgi:hypothetical protein